MGDFPPLGAKYECLSLGLKLQRIRCYSAATTRYQLLPLQMDLSGVPFLTVIGLKNDSDNINIIVSRARKDPE